MACHVGGTHLENFREVFDKNHRPTIDELDLFWDKELVNLFRRLSDDLMEKYNLRFAIPVWNEENGWTYRIGRGGVFLFSNIILFENGFLIDGIKVMDEKSYHQLLIHIDSVVQERGKEFENQISERNKRQKERTQARIEREKQKKQALLQIIVPEKYNQFRWPDKLNLTKLRRLYQLDALGIENESLADEVGITLFVRCSYGKSDMELMEKHAIRCHHCGKALYDTNDFIECSCGYQYSYQEYRRSYRNNNMPTGAATTIFNQYIIDWPRAKTYREKILLIDELLHEFHRSLVSGTVNRPVAMNFIDGSRKKIQDIITELSL